MRDSPPVMRPSQLAFVGSSTLTTITSAAWTARPWWSTAVIRSGAIAYFGVRLAGAASPTWYASSDDRCANAVTGTTVSRPPTRDVTVAPAWPGAGTNRTRAEPPVPRTWTWSPSGSGYTRVARPAVAAG